MKRTLITLCLLSCLAAGPSTAAQEGMAHFYVSPDGNDQNDGTKTKPWRTLQHAADHLTLGKNGVVIHVAAGTYSEMGYCSVEGLVRSPALVCLQKSGSPAQPIVFQTDEKWAAKLKCNKGGGLFLLIGSHIRVVGFDMSCPQEGSFAGATYADNGHNQFLNNYVHDFDVSGCSSIGVLNGNISAKPGWRRIGHHVVSGNAVRHAGALTKEQPQCNQEHGLYFGDPYDVLSNNVISGIVGLGIHNYGGGVCHQIISNNTVFDNSQGGILIENVATREGYWDECGNGGLADYNTVTNNIVVNNGIGRNYVGGNGGIDARGQKSGRHNVFSNNLVSDNRPMQTALTPPDKSIGERSGSATSVFANYQPDHNWEPVTHYDVRNYALRKGSPAIGAGTRTCAHPSNYCPPLTDFAGTARPKGKAYDLGAFKFRRPSE